MGEVWAGARAARCEAGTAGEVSGVAAGVRLWTRWWSWSLVGVGTRSVHALVGREGSVAPGNSTGPAPSAILQAVEQYGRAE